MSEKTMKCKKCGSEITEGRYCKHCKAERKEEFNKGVKVVAAVAVACVGVVVKSIMGYPSNKDN